MLLFLRGKCHELTDFAGSAVATTKEETYGTNFFFLCWKNYSEYYSFGFYRRALT